jgi:hypothetical protein
VWGYAYEVEHEGGGFAATATHDAIRRYGNIAVPYKARVVTDAGTLSEDVLVDVGHGFTLWAPPSRTMTVELVGPENLQVVPPNTSLQLAAGFLVNAILAVSAFPTEWMPAGVRRNRLSRTIDLAAAAVVDVPVPWRTKRAAWYTAAGVFGSPVQAEWYRLAGASDDSLGILEPNRICLVPGAANVVRVAGDAMDTSRAVLVFELEV